MSDSNYQSSPAELICNLKGHFWGAPNRDEWMNKIAGVKNNSYHKCERCYAEVTHVEYDCHYCKGSSTCDGVDQEEPHTCPFAEEINNDSTSLCTCCRSCQHECAMDI